MWRRDWIRGSLFDVDPLDGEEMEHSLLLRRAYATPKALVQRAAEFYGSGGLLRAIFG